MYKKQVGIIYDYETKKPILLVEVQTLDNLDSYLALKKECDNNFKEYNEQKTNTLSSFENGVNEKINKLAKAIKEQIL